MNGAKSLLLSLLASDVDICFANPGTSEMNFVAALDEVSGMRAVLGLFEGVVTGAADGYGRMAGKPACTLLHLGPGLANGLANLHNARRAATPIVNIVGEHATSHSRFDAPLTTDIHAIASPMSHWVYTSKSARTVGSDAARAVQAARQMPGQIATLILPADTAWGEAERAAAPLALPLKARVDERVIADLLTQVRRRKTVFLLRGDALQERGLQAASRIAHATGARIMCDTFYPRMQRGAGRPMIERMPYFGEHVAQALQGTELIVLVGAQAPVSFFAYPDKPSWLTPEGCQLSTLSYPHEDGTQALEALAEALQARDVGPLAARHEDLSLSSASTLSAAGVMHTVSRLLPENAIVLDEAISSGFASYGMTEHSQPHDFLNLTGGAIGSMMAVAVGAAIACPERKVVTLQGDGSAMYILQALWTQARERLNVLTIIYANRSYKILANELARVGAAGHSGKQADALFSLEDPALDWVALAKGMGVEGVRVETQQAFNQACTAAMAMNQPFVIEIVL